MGLAKLFVKSVKVPVLRYEVRDIPGHYCQDGYRTESPLISFSPDDERAKRILAGSGLGFETVDLSGTGSRRMTVWFGRVRKTPTLLVEDGRRRRYEGVRAISDYVESQR